MPRWMICKHDEGHFSEKDKVSSATRISKYKLFARMFGLVGASQLYGLSYVCVDYRVAYNAFKCRVKNVLHFHTFCVDVRMPFVLLLVRLLTQFLDGLLCWALVGSLARSFGRALALSCA